MKIRKKLEKRRRRVEEVRSENIITPALPDGSACPVICKGNCYRCVVKSHN
jgi:hypothetical protein